MQGVNGVQGRGAGIIKASQLLSSSSPPWLKTHFYSLTYYTATLRTLSSQEQDKANAAPHCFNFLPASSTTPPTITFSLIVSCICFPLQPQHKQPYYISSASKHIAQVCHRIHNCCVGSIKHQQHQIPSNPSLKYLTCSGAHSRMKRS